ncbi:hypothetical protein [Erythrobacter sp.]|uniref:hypothetical protein n=1 Tax=Erythrobacter sp. TaxID=1042 RepID=UPI002EA7B7A8|nr:hypothetical protein [Erythrobacter sp.]
MKTYFTALLAAGCALALVGCNGGEEAAEETTGAEAPMEEGAMEDGAMAGEAEMTETPEEDDPLEGTGNPIGPMAPASDES